MAKKIEPVRYNAARKTYLANIEGVHLSAVMNFFSLALAQINKQIAEMNYSNADTLYRIAREDMILGLLLKMSFYRCNFHGLMPKQQESRLI